jgi:hypothetical protein
MTLWFAREKTQMNNRPDRWPWKSGLAFVVALACHTAIAQEVRNPVRYPDRYATAEADAPAPAVLAREGANAVRAERPLPCHGRPTNRPKANERDRCNRS